METTLTGMKNTSTNTALLTALFVLLFASVPSGCTREIEQDGNDMRIRIGASISSSVISTKAGSSTAPYLDYDSDEALDISVLRWDEDGTPVPSGLERFDAVMGKPSRDGNWLRKITFGTDNTQFYVDRVKETGFIGWYPSASDNWEKTSGTEQIVHPDNSMKYTIDGMTDVMVSTFEKGSFATGIPNLKFRHALCMYNIYAYAVDEDTKEEWGNLTEVVLMNLPEKLIVKLPDDITAGQASFSYEDGSKKKYNIVSAASEQDQVELVAGFPPSGQGLIGTVLGGSPNDGIIGITAKTSRQTTGNSVSIARNFKPGYSYNIYLKFSSKGIINAEVSVIDWQYSGDEYIDLKPDVKMFTDLSRYGTANSYIVSSANIGYCFDGTVKGNGVNTFTDNDGNVIELPDRITSIDPDEIRIIRSDAMMKLENGKMTYIEDYKERVTTPIIKLASDKLSEGKVLFEVPGNPSDPDDYSLQYKGNVKIGAYKNGELVWSWHIWVTDRPYDQGYANGYSAMDRNLGAVTTDYNDFKAARSHWSGLYYQWGRKDAIFRPTVDERPEWNEFWPRNVKPAASLEEIHRDPTAYYYTEGSGSWTTDTENQEHFWGYVGPYDEYVKTMYDPCPPGYRVPENSSWQASDAAMDITRLTNGQNEFAGYGFNIGGMIDIYYPGTACLAEGKLEYSDDRNQSVFQDESYLYSATPHINADGLADGNVSYHFSYRDGKDMNSVLVSDSENYHTEWTAAYPVRCILESSSPIVNNLSKSQTANSYVVSKPGFYRFKANVRGNGVTGLNIFQDDYTFFRAFDAGMGSAITGIDRIDVLWWQGDLKPGSEYRTFAESNPSSEDIETECPVKVLNNGRLKDDYAMIYVNANENTYGNVGLAAYDSNDNILWTWHIWIQPGTFVVKLGDYTVMDRNLGATYVPEYISDLNGSNITACMGMFYQWGRKDPFFPPATQTETGKGTYWWFRKTGSMWERFNSNDSRQKASIQSSVENPLAFFTSGNTFWQITYTNYKGEANDFWGYVGSAGAIGESFAKTMYDPCPPGYKVMQHNVFRSANICKDNEEDKYNLNSYNGYGLYLTSGMSTGLGNIICGNLWFPNCPAIKSDGVFTGSDGTYRLSTATPYYDTNILNTREIRWSKNATYYSIQQKHTDNWMVAARVVRCQME